ncbi:hypothetical protein [Kribbella italica]|uniref:GNAT family N-acetyltransferase n=1 Tax=Kribbella italica TaxID=1540520 RepID=A0A7W9JEG6_9ACTN|nr:hypothetical protein [Kribbella italica]MBB5839968.1 hypothetical protein [Kribbella italica]
MTVSVLTYLEQTSPYDVRPAKNDTAEVRRVEEVSPEFARYFYSSVGGDWHWTTKLEWDWARWIQHLTRPAFETWVAHTGGVPAGYIALKGEGTEVEVENYKARGMRPYKTEQEERPDADGPPPGPWPGANRSAAL